LGRPALTDDQRAVIRARIQTAALTLHREGGLEAVTMRAVAERAGLSSAALYSYFDNRQTLLQSLWYEPAAAAVRRSRLVASRTPDPVKRIEAILGVYLDLARKNPEVFRGAFLFVRPGSMEAPPIQKLETLDFHRLICEAVKEAQASGAARPGDARLIAQALWAGLHGALALPITLEMYDFAPAPKLASEVVRLLIQGVLKP
jgi:AcrR family transcriptional regulator